MSDPDISYAKKKFVRDLMTIVIVQVVALSGMGSGLFLFSGDVVPNYPDWDGVHLLCGVLALSGMVTFLVATVWGVVKLMYLITCRLKKEMISNTTGFVLDDVKTHILKDLDENNV